MLNPTVAINYAKVIMNNKSIDIDKLYACFYNVSVFLSEHDNCEEKNILSLAVKLSLPSRYKRSSFIFSVGIMLW